MKHPVYLTIDLESTDRNSVQLPLTKFFHIFINKRTRTPGTPCIVDQIEIRNIRVLFVTTANVDNMYQHTQEH